VRTQAKLVWISGTPEAAEQAPNQAAGMVHRNLQGGDVFRRHVARFFTKPDLVAKLVERPDGDAKKAPELLFSGSH